jgi:hypothetical protein
MTEAIYTSLVAINPNPEVEFALCVRMLCLENKNIGFDERSAVGATHRVAPCIYGGTWKKSFPATSRCFVYDNGRCFGDFRVY